MNGKKGFSVGDLLPLGMTILVLGITLALGMTLLSDFKSDSCTGYYNETTGGCYINAVNLENETLRTNTFNGTNDANTGLMKFTTYLPTIALVIIVSVIIAVIVRYLMVR